MSEFILVSTAAGIATITLNRPEKRNALHAQLIEELSAALKTVAADDETRLVLLTGKGTAFCAGGDIAWMQKMGCASLEENERDAQGLADLLYQLYTLPKPTIALAQGACLGGGVGLLAATDMVIAASDAHFALPEVKIGITPSMISPYVVAAIGARQAHYYFLSGDAFSAAEAHRLGLVHQLCDAEALMSAGVTLATTVSQHSRAALRAAKQLIRHVANKDITERLAQETAEHLAALRSTAEAQEGLRAYLEKRQARW